MNRKVSITDLLRRIADDLGCGFETYAYDWVKHLYTKEKSLYVYGYRFPNNSASFSSLADDKACTYEVLSKHGAPAVEHFYFMSPRDLHFLTPYGIKDNWTRMKALQKRYGKLVCKPNSGTGGTDLYLVENETELEVAVGEIFSRFPTLSLSPYYEIEDEYRVILLDGVPQLVFRKIRPHVVGNGKDSLTVLIASQLPVGTQLKKGLPLSSVPRKGDTVEVGWKHNLGAGAEPEVLTGGEIYEKVVALAKKAMDILGGAFASVDCVKIGKEFRVLEVNAGVMMENFAGTGAKQYETAKRIYERAVKSYWELK